MAEFVTLSCPSCGARLEIGNGTDRFARAYCDQEHIVQRSGGIVRRISGHGKLLATSRLSKCAPLGHEPHPAKLSTVLQTTAKYKPNGI